MKRALMTVVGVGLSCCLSLELAAAGDGMFGPAPAGRGAGAAPVRTIFGLPIPQQWTGQRPGLAGTAGNGGTVGRGAVCRNGTCPTSQSGALRPDISQYGSARPGTGVAGRVSGGNCPGGVCPVPPSAQRVPPATDQGWSGSVTQSKPTSRGVQRSEPADPFRPASRTRIDDESWFNRPVTAPLRDAFGSGYSSRELDLRRDYFSRGRDEDGQQERVPPSGRSMEAPVPSKQETARI